MYRHSYRKGISKLESEAIRQLRLRGYAVVILHAGTLARGGVEDAMRKAAHKAMKEVAT